MDALSWEEATFVTESMPGDAPAPRPTLRTVAACAVYSLSLLSMWLLNSTAYPGFNDFFPMARDVATVFGALFAFVLAFAAMRRPRVLVSRGFLVLCVAAMLAGVGAMFVGARLQSPLLSSLGACLRSAAPFVNAAYVALMLSGLSRRSCFVFLAVSYLLKYGWMGALWHTPLGVKWAIFAVLPALCTVALYLFARRQLGRVDCPEPPGDLAITNPLSFLPFTHGLFVVILMFSAAQGFVITYGSQNSLPMPFVFAGIPVAVVMALVACGCLGRLDGLYTVAFGLVLAGLLLVPASLSGLLEAGLAVNTLLNAGNDVFNLVVVFMAAQIAARNLYAALPMIMAVRVASGLGTELGASTGHLANYATGGNPMFMLVAIAACTLAFTLYNFYVMRKFSFDRTILGIEPVRWVASDAVPHGAVSEPPQRDRAAEGCGSEGGLAASDGASDTGSAPTLDGACDALAAERGLTARESQVLALLARGRNVAYIQQGLVLSRNTVKSYVASVYSKLGVHSHQAVIDLVEEKARCDGSAGRAAE